MYMTDRVVGACSIGMQPLDLHGEPVPPEAKTLENSRTGGAYAAEELADQSTCIGGLIL